MTDKTCLAIWDRGRIRKALMREMVSLENRMRGLVRSQLGFSTRKKVEEMNKAELKQAEAFKEEAKKIVTALLKGKDTDNNRVLSLAGFINAYNELEASRKDIEAQMIQYAKKLPYYEWAMEQPGIADLSFATLLAEIVDLNDYSNPAKVWKRMGVGVIGGERQRKVAGNAELAVEHGYNAQRRSEIWNISKRIVMQKNRRPDHPWIVYYVAEKEKQLAKGLTKGHAEKRARIHTGKKMLKHMWREAQKYAVVDLDQAA